MTAPETQNAMNIRGGGTISSEHTRVSVAMATYNGEKYIEEQLLSICRQTRKPDEIVISDDGSKDATLEIVERVSQSEDAAGIDFVIITDNPRHGYCGNFEWALKHSTGDYIFLSDQDDVWTEDKVFVILQVFQQHHDAQCVCHNATLINEVNIPIDGVFEESLHRGKLNIAQGTIIKVDRESFLEAAVGWIGFRGMVMAFHKSFLQVCIPFPNGLHAHDIWLAFCAVLEDTMYYTNCYLAKYRLHGNNTCGSAIYRGNAIDRIKRFVYRLQNISGTYGHFYQLGLAQVQRMEDKGILENPAYSTAKRVIQIGASVRNAEMSGRIQGAIKLSALFCTDMRFRRSGTKGFLKELMYILYRSKKYRITIVSGEQI